MSPTTTSWRAKVLDAQDKVFIFKTVEAATREEARQLVRQALPGWEFVIWNLEPLEVAA